MPFGSFASSSGSTWMTTRTLGISDFRAASIRSQMTWLSPTLIAASTNVDAPFVIAMQMMRFVVVMFVLPPVARRLMRDAPDARRSHIGTPNDIHNRR